MKFVASIGISIAEKFAKEIASLASSSPQDTTYHLVSNNDTKLAGIVRECGFRIPNLMCESVYDYHERQSSFLRSPQRHILCFIAFSEHISDTLMPYVMLSLMPVHDAFILADDLDDEALGWHGIASVSTSIQSFRETRWSVFSRSGKFIRQLGNAFSGMVLYEYGELAFVRASDFERQCMACQQACKLIPSCHKCMKIGDALVVGRMCPEFADMLVTDMNSAPRIGHAIEIKESNEPCSFSLQR